MTEMSGQNYPPQQQPWADPQQQGYQTQTQTQPQQGYQYPPQQQGYAPQQQQGYQYPPQQQMPAQQPILNPTNELQCRMCGSFPAKKATFRGHRGIIVVMQFLSEKGPFCRDCGIATFRTMTSRTLVQGWWGYASFIITPFTLLINLFQRLKFKDMPAPRPAPDGNSIAPLPVGKPVFLRPTIAGLLVPLSLFGVIAYAIVSGVGDPQNYVGQCIKVVANDEVDFVSCDQTNDGQVISVVDSADKCTDEATGVVERTSTSRRGRETTLDFLCVK